MDPRQQEGRQEVLGEGIESPNRNDRHEEFRSLDHQVWRQVDGRPVCLEQK